MHSAPSLFAAFAMIAVAVFGLWSKPGTDIGAMGFPHAAAISRATGAQ